MKTEKGTANLELEDPSPTIVPLSILDPEIFLAVEALCRIALVHSKNCSEVRKAVIAVFQEMRSAARTKYDLDTVDAVRLLRLIRQTDPMKDQRFNGRAKLVFDPLTDLTIVQRLDDEQMAAAYMIREVWDSFSKMLTFSTRRYEKDEVDNKKVKALGPVELMNERLWRSYQRQYIPWFEKAKLRSVAKRHALHPRYMTHASLVIAVIVEATPPKQLDASLCLRPGTTLRILDRELDCFCGELYPGEEDTDGQESEIELQGGAAGGAEALQTGASATT